MKRIFPASLRDSDLLSRLLHDYLILLKDSPLQVSLKTISYESKIPEAVLERLANWHKEGQGNVPVETRDFHIVFANLLFRYPTVKIWGHRNGYLFEI